MNKYRLQMGLSLTSLTLSVHFMQVCVHADQVRVTGTKDHLHVHVYGLALKSICVHNLSSMIGTISSLNDFIFFQK